MDKKDLILYLKTNNKSGYKTRETHFKKHLPKFYNEIICLNNFRNWYEKLYAFIYNLTEIPICKNNDCDNKLKFKNINLGYHNYCSMKCKNTDINLINKIKENNIRKYGVDNPMKCENIKEKSKEIKLKRYGDENYNNHDKAKKTKIEKYNDKYFNNREKCKKTNIKKYGIEYYTNREKALKTVEKLYGDKNYNNRKKYKETNLKKYGVEYPMQFNKIKEKAKQTNLKKYGVVSHTQTQNYKQNIYKKAINKIADKLNINVENIELKNDEFYVKTYCDKHILFKINKHVLKNRINYGIKNICTKCNPISKQSSIKENELKEYIKSLNVDFEENNKSILNGQELDIYLKEYNLAIEFDGLYYHSNLFVDKNYHINKTEECEKQGIQLLHIFEDEWINKSEIVKSIIKNKLNLCENRIYGRKCEIKEINDNKLIKEFLDNNHIQGFIGSKHKIGLFYDNELVSIMTFGKKRKIMNTKSQEGEYEMLRFCNKLNSTVIGGASKLLKYFIKTYKPNEIISYADRRYSNGNLYEKLNFKYIKKTEPNYWYFTRSSYGRKHRFGFRKDILVKQGYDPLKTEHEIMLERGYLRIYDCGNLKFEYIS